MTDFQSLQRQFAGHVRDPERVPPPADIQDRRMAVYRELAFNNVAGLLAANFPVLRSRHDPAGWQALVRDWYRGHRARTPLFPALGGEFVTWLQQVGAVPDWQVELAHYEWMATVAANARADLDGIRHDPDGDLIDGRPLLSPLVWPLRYRHAVQRLRAGEHPDADAGAGIEQPTFLVIVRDRQDRVGFLAANALTLALVERLHRSQGRLSGRELLAGLASDTGIDHDRMLSAGRDMFGQLRQRHIILGTLPDPL
ncbi:MAG: putative DNA-binding domain-containing protein [Xanthomonadales bacterium]|nr:putative DNA-binding domain-containing protein [Xanthomonadales bacterium]